VLNETFVPDERKAELRSRLGRIQGEVSGVGRMLDENKPSMDILTPAAQEALRGFSRIMVLNYLEKRATAAVREGRQDDVYEDLMRVIFRLAR
jgi:DNA-binding FrmR family transcriptional regulator